MTNSQKGLNSLLFVCFVLFCKKFGQEKPSWKKSILLQNKQTALYSGLFWSENSRSFSHFQNFIIFHLDIFFFLKKKTLLVCPWRIYELRDVGSIKERSSQKGAWFLEGVHVQLTDPLCDNITVLEILKVVVLKFTRRFSNNIFDYYILRGNKLPTLLHFDLNYLRK